MTLRLAALEQAIHTPMLALVTMLHRNVVIVHGSDDAWADPDEATLLADALAAGGERPGGRPRRRVPATTSRRLATNASARLPRMLAGRMEPRELPPVLVAIERDGRWRARLRR